MTRSSTESKTSLALAANLSELKLKKILIEKIEGNKSIHRSNEQKNLYKALDDEDKDEEPSARSNRGSKRRRAGKEPESTSTPKEKTSKTTGKSIEGSKSQHKSAGESAYTEEPMHTAKDLEEPAHQEFDIGATEDQSDEETSQHPDWFQKPAKLPTPDRDWNKTLLAVHGPVNLEYVFEEVYKATTDQLDWNNPEGQQYPHDLRKPLPLIPNSRGRQVIPFDHFINNDLAIYQVGPPAESARDDYSKRRIIIVIKLQIVEWYGYKHLDWITVRRDDENHNIKKNFQTASPSRYRRHTDSSCSRRVEDLQLGVESYHKKLNITKPDTYRSDLKRRDAYTAYYNPKGFIYQNKDKKNKVIGTKSSDDLCDRQTAQSRRIIKFRKNLLVGDRTRFDTSAGNPVKEILLKLNLPDHRILKDGGEERYEHVGPEVTSSQDGKVHKMAKRDYAWLMISRPDIMFVVYACARFQVTPKVSHLHVVKRVFRYLKGKPKLGLWYPKDSPFNLEAYSDSDYAGASLDRKSTTKGCQFLGSRLISWQCKKQTIVANSTTEVEYVAAANCCGQVLWIQNQMLDYGYNFMNTKIFIDNESTICIVKNSVFHSKTKHIEIIHHFIRDSYKKRLIQVIKIHTDHNVADLLTKALDVSRFQFLTASIRMLNL
ncbi:hypothetical protein Tco_0381298 [Tanacetum coccineum]